MKFYFRLRAGDIICDVIMILCRNKLSDAAGMASIAYRIDTTTAASGKPKLNENKFTTTAVSGKPKLNEKINLDTSLKYVTYDISPPKKKLSTTNEQKN